MSASWGPLGYPAQEKVAGWRDGPHGAFAAHVRRAGDPLWGLACVDPDLAAEIESAGWQPDVHFLHCEVCRRRERHHDAGDQTVAILREIFRDWRAGSYGETQVPNSRQSTWN